MEKITTNDLQKADLLKDYEMKVNYLKDHLSRMWTRFNIFLTLQTGLAGAKIVYVSKANETIAIDSNLAKLALLLSGVWFFVGIIDRSLVKNYRGQVGQSFERLKIASNDATFTDLPHTGQVELERMNVFEKALHSVFSPTKIIFVVPAISIVVWVMTLIK
jgi:hypothetical protein